MEAIRQSACGCRLMHACRERTLTSQHFFREEGSPGHRFPVWGPDTLYRLGANWRATSSLSTAAAGCRLCRGSREAAFAVCTRRHASTSTSQPTQSKVPYTWLQRTYRLYLDHTPRTYPHRPPLSLCYPRHHPSSRNQIPLPPHEAQSSPILTDLSQRRVSQISSTSNLPGTQFMA